MATALPIKKQTAHIKPTRTGDVDTGMQRATANGGIGVIATAPGTPAPGADISAAAEANYHSS